MLSFARTLIIYSFSLHLCLHKYYIHALVPSLVKYYPLTSEASREVANLTERNNDIYSPAVVAWFIKASVFQSVNSAPSANGGYNNP